MSYNGKSEDSSHPFLAAVVRSLVLLAEIVEELKKIRTTRAEEGEGWANSRKIISSFNLFKNVCERSWK